MQDLNSARKRHGQTEVCAKVIDCPELNAETTNTVGHMVTQRGDYSVARHVSDILKFHQPANLGGKRGHAREIQTDDNQHV